MDITRMSLIPAFKMSGYTSVILIIIAIADGSIMCPRWPNIPNDDIIISPDQTKCYIIMDRRFTWYIAKSKCELFGGKLLQIHSKEENDFLKPTILRAGRQCYWIGLSDQQKEGTWRWSDGTLAKYKPVDEGTYSVILRWTQDCVTLCKGIIFRSMVTWSPKVCDATSWGMVCQADVVLESTIPTPVTLSENLPHKTRDLRQSTTRTIRKMVDLDDYKLLSKPDMVKRVRLATQCARDCQTVLSPCEVFNFHAPSNICLGFSSAEVVQLAKAHEDKWTTWTTTYL